MAIVIPEADVISSASPAWEVPIDVPIQRQAREMADCVAPMLRCATRILFVDPHFDPYRERYREPLGKFLRHVDRRRGTITIELHAGDHGGKALPDAADHFREQCRTDLPRIIPTGLELTVYYWKERLGGKELHNRFILTDIGGVQFGHGLDCDLGGRSDDIISRLGVKSYSREWNDYAGPNGAFDLDGEVFTVEGRAAD